MTFLSILYGVFLLSVLGIYWAVNGRSIRLWIILFASLVFYSSLQIYYAPLLLGIAFVTYWIGAALNTPRDSHLADNEWEFAQQDWNRRRLKLLWLGIALNVLLLLGFKYIPFVVSSVGTAFNLPIALQSADWIAARLLAPLGISFFSFECIAYLVDVYRGAPATNSFLKFSAYKLYFPKLISGPITRFHPFAAQLEALQFPKTQQITEGLWLIACGAVKKLLLADHLGRVVNLTFDNLERAGSGDLWLATFAYGLQLYLDFSGYVDVARGSAALMGFELPQNFYFPYFCTNIADFWRRWHITLGDWLRNYLYFPLGGSRRGLARTCLNLLIVMLIAGIWHGAAWGYVVWGGIHGVMLVMHRLSQAISDRVHFLKLWWNSIPGVILAWAMTQVTVFTAWIFFRLPDLGESGLVIQRLFGHAADAQFAQKVYVEALQIGRPQIAFLLVALSAAIGVVYAFNRGLKLQLNWTVKILLVPVCLFVAWLLAPNESPPYIYFDF